MTKSWSFSFDSLGTPGHLRPSANGPASISWHNFQRLRWLVSSVDAVLFSNVHSKFTASALGCSEETLFISFSKGVTGVLRHRTCLEKDTNECSCLICDSSCCRTSCVSVQPCTPKVLPNTETFLHSRVFFVTCVAPALCQIKYSLYVCSDGPPAGTLSLTEWRIQCSLTRFGPSWMVLVGLRDCRTGWRCVLGTASSLSWADARSMSRMVTATGAAVDATKRMYSSHLVLLVSFSGVAREGDD